MKRLIGRVKREREKNDDWHASFQRIAIGPDRSTSLSDPP